MCVFISSFLHFTEVIDLSFLSLYLSPLLSFFSSHSLACLRRISLGFFSRTAIQEFGPVLPAQLAFRAQEMKQFLLAKLVNGLISAMIRSPPMNRLYYVPRGAAIEDLVAKYPRESDKEMREREKQAAKDRAKMREDYAGLPRELVVRVNSARNIRPNKDGSASTYAEVKLQEQRHRTDVVKKNTSPIWNAAFRLDLVGVEVDFATIEINVYEKGLLSDEFIGAYVCTVADAMKNKQEQTAPLRPKGDPNVSVGEIVFKMEAEAPEMHIDGEDDLTQYDWYHGNQSGSEAYKLVEA